MVKVARLEVSEKKGFRVVLKGLRCPGIVRSRAPRVSGISFSSFSDSCLERACRFGVCVGEVGRKSAGVGSHGLFRLCVVSRTGRNAKLSSATFGVCDFDYGHNDELLFVAR